MRASRLVTAVVLVGVAAGGGWLAWNRLAAQEKPAGGGEGSGPAKVRVVPVETARVERLVEAVGTLVAVESVALTAEVPGRVEAILFRQGERVEAGAELVRLERDEAEAEVRTRQAEVEEIVQTQARAQTLADRKVGPRAAADDLQARVDAARARAAAAESRVDDYIVRAPFAGRLGLRDLSVGAQVEPGRELVTLDTITPIDLRFSVPERHLGEVGPGAKVAAESVAYPGRRFEGEVRAVDSRVDPALRAVEMEARLDNADGALRPGMFMGLKVSAGVREDAVVVPPAAVQVRGATHFAFRVVDDKAERVEVRIGQRAPDRLEILEGLKAGDRVVVEGLQRVASGKPVEVEGGQPQPAGQAGPGQQPARGPES